MSLPAKFWENLAEAVGHPEMLERPEFATREARIANYEAVVAYLAPLFAESPRDLWCERLTGREVPNSPVRTSAEVLASPQAQHLGLTLQTQGPRGAFRTVRPPLRFDGQALTELTAPPEVGQHNDEILGDRGHRRAERDN